MAERIAYLVEEYELLPKALSLVSFDVKGAYSNVATEPETTVRWVQDLYTERQACMFVNGTTTEVRYRRPHMLASLRDPLLVRQRRSGAERTATRQLDGVRR